MVRSKFYNGASLILIRFFFFIKFSYLFYSFLWNQPSQFYWFAALDLSILGIDYPYMDEFRILMLYYTTFYEMTHRPLHSRILYHWYLFSIFLSPLHLSVYSYCFTTNNQIFFISVAIIISPHRSLFWFSIFRGSLYPDNGKRWVGY